MKLHFLLVNSFYQGKLIKYFHIKMNKEEDKNLMEEALKRQDRVKNELGAETLQAVMSLKILLIGMRGVSLF